MIIQAIYCMDTHEILYSRSLHDCRYSSDGSCYIDGGFEYCRIGGDASNILTIDLNGDFLLKHILSMDYNVGTNNADKYPNGFHGRFEITERSNKYFYIKLIKNFYEVEDVLFPIDKTGEV